ncbi:SHOCT domain-containing protein [Ruicaihuangia caeni]|uniref:SHOCT domain-containing protein n=1 Tax=Ruicaihuangia caeni TaxID=3042517 RepID=A0AAW6T5L2_9MICO|nr:SHOCT domain-containing protein [Klugiella sp. YN-L-19]MDI2098371.1 SHOCT domain-containing protein [Klugiella sp. YN-L-19]
MVWNHGFGAWWMWIPGLLLMALVVAAIVVLIVLLTRSTGQGRGWTGGMDHGAPPHDRARQLLEERLVRGEVTPQQYRELLETLESGRRGRSES